MPRSRRFILSTVLLLCAGLAVFCAAAAPQVDGRRVSIEAADAQQFLEARFPQQHDALGGLVTLGVSRPRLELPPGTRLRLGLDLALATAGGTPAPVGSVVLSSALRYDTTQKAFFLEQPRVEDFVPTGGRGGGLDPSTRQLLDAWAADYARTEPVYRVDPAIAAMLGDLQVQSAGVDGGRLVVEFNRDVGAQVPAAD